MKHINRRKKGPLTISVDPLQILWLPKLFSPSQSAKKRIFFWLSLRPADTFFMAWTLELSELWKFLLKGVESLKGKLSGHANCQYFRSKHNKETYKLICMFFLNSLKNLLGENVHLARCFSVYSIACFFYYWPVFSCPINWLINWLSFCLKSAYFLKLRLSPHYPDLLQRRKDQKKRWLNWFSGRKMPGMS